MRNKLYNFFIENGVILRPVGNIVYILPPYIITENQLQKVYPVSYTHLDVYKRQTMFPTGRKITPFSMKKL